MRAPTAQERHDRRRMTPCLSGGHGLLLPLLLLGCAACGDRPAESRRGELEARYGPRVGVADTVAATSTPGGAPEPTTTEPATTGPASSDSGDARGEPSASTGAPSEPTDPGSRVREGDTPAAVTPAPPPPADPAADDFRQTPGDEDSQAFDVTALLAAAEDAYASLTSLRASFVQVMEVPLLERTSRGTGMWYQKGRARFRMDFEDPPDDELVADGTYLWIYHPSQNPEQVIRSELGVAGADSGTPDLLARILSEARTGYDAHYDGRGMLDGVELHIVTLMPTGRSPYRSVRIWIGTRDRLVRRFRIVEVNESIRTVTLSNLEPNAALADSLFRFTVPPGADVFSG